MEKTPVGFIGLGRMGGAMAANLLAAGVPLVVFDTRQESVQSLVARGATVGCDPADVAAKVDLLFLCLPFTPEVEEVLFARNGVITVAGAGFSIVDATTMYCTDAVRFQSRLAEVGIEYSDCPISGMPFRAENGTLTIMFGGDEQTFESTHRYLDVMGEFIVHCGECGTGQMMKAFNNIIYDINIAGVCEIMPMAIKAGLKPETLERVFTTASARSFASEYFIPRLLDRRFDSDFAMEDAYKDIVNVQEIATRLKASIPMVKAMVSSYENALEMGLGREPKSAMVKVYEKVLGMEVLRSASDTDSGE